MMSFIATVLLIPVIILQIIFILRNKKEKITPWISLVSGILLYVELTLRSFQIGFPALTNTFEALLFFAATTLIVAGILSLRGSVSEVISFGSIAVALILLLVASSPIAPKDINPPIPALQSNWLLLHVSFSFIGQSFFIVSFIGAIAALRSKDNKEKYTKVVVNSIIIGYPIYTAGAIIFGSIWAASAWGSFWSWDPKETWSLITWFVYTIYLHGRHTKYISGNQLLWLSIIGFAVSLFTFFGVNFLLSGLHSYG